MERWVVYDAAGVITETTDEEEAREAFKSEDGHHGDLVLAQVLEVRR